MIENGKKYLVTADNWFYGTDGHQYRAAYGICKVVEFKEAFGFVPARPSTNWLLQIGEGERQVLIAGCQIHFLIKTDTPPAFIEGTLTDKDGDTAPANRIFFANPLDEAKAVQRNAPKTDRWVPPPPPVPPSTRSLKQGDHFDHPHSHERDDRDKGGWQ